MTQSSPDISYAFALVVVAIFVAYLAYDYGKSKARFYYVPRNGYRSPDLEQLVIRAKYAIKATSVKQIFEKIQDNLNFGWPGSLWTGDLRGNTISFTRVLGTPRKDLLRRFKDASPFLLKLGETRSGIPIDLLMVGSDVKDGRVEFDVTVRPALYRQIAQLGKLECTSQEIQDAQHECISFVQSVLKGMPGGIEIDPPSVRSASLMTDVCRRLTMWGMPSQADLLDKAEAKIIAGAPEDGAKNCRSAVEQVLENLMIRVGLERTDSFTHNLERVASHRYLDPWVAESIHQFYYRLVSEDAHDKYRPGPKEARYILSMTEAAIEFLLSRIG